MTSAQQSLPPLDHSIATAVAGFVEFSSSRDTAKRPSHRELGELFIQCGIVDGDPKRPDRQIGKQRRVNDCLTWAISNDIVGGRRFVDVLVRKLRGWGGFRAESENFVGREAIENARAAFENLGWSLDPNGSLLPTNVETLSGVALTDTLKGYARRAMEGADDSALVVGTAKDLLEATARHVLLERGHDGNKVQRLNFPSLIGMAFTELDMATAEHRHKEGEPVERDLERALYSAALAVNKLRNHEGTGHGRPWPTDLSVDSAATASRLSGLVAHRLLAALGD